ncbi:DUF5331 domain-containing protein [Brunnivagina elsteri]|uniref:DUF5331 domain-containing protein n=1 Tax=Brunnivagina elsteri CCALA 953 TaxID=987040 RepID=A0A2A2TIT7_9CYAN|nr:DUF5331 domain-containing protein [Calothrix elsteri]PAX53804.1 hypothetical protein CK510_13365 [Calothrix elsteri CCALA 953]
MAFFYSFTESLKQKWLQFFQANRDWILLHMQVESVYTPDGGKRPPSYLILGVANALEPKLSQLMLPFSKLNPDADTLIEVLGLHFDPDMALGNSAIPPVEEESDIMASEITGATQVAVTSNFTDAVSVESLMAADVLGNEDGIPAENYANPMSMASISEPEVSGFGKENMSVAEANEDFGADISFDIEASAAKMEYNALEDINTSEEENAFSDVLMDVWGEEAQAKKAEAGNEMVLGEEFGTNAFEEDSEIARLFPNG